MSKTLRFNEWFYKPIMEEKKTSTIRTKHHDLCEDDKVKFLFTDGKTIDAEITSMERIRYGRLEECHATSEGYNHVDLLKKELENIYGELTDDAPLYVIYFTIPQPKEKQEYMILFQEKPAGRVIR